MCLDKRTILSRGDITLIQGAIRLALWVALLAGCLVENARAQNNPDPLWFTEYFCDGDIYDGDPVTWTCHLLMGAQALVTEEAWCYGIMLRASTRPAVSIEATSMCP